MKSALQKAISNGLIGFGILAFLMGLYALITEPGVLQRFWSDIVSRPDGPMSFRFLLQPVMATLAAWKDGKRDAATGLSPYFWTVLTDPALRGPRLREGALATGKILALGVLMDVVYQGIVLKEFYPMEALVVALVLAFVPYLLLRGPFARVAARRPH